MRYEWTKDPEAMKKWKAEYYQKNKAAIRDRQNQLRLADPEKRKGQVEKYKATNDVNKVQRDWRLANPVGTYVLHGIRQRLKESLGCSIDQVPEDLCQAKLAVVTVQRAIKGLRI